MAQSYKNVYFRDFPRTASTKSSLTLAFGQRDQDVFRAVRNLSSEAVRQALGRQSFAELQEGALEQQKTLNAFCLAILRQRFEAARHTDAAYLPGFAPDNPISLDPIQATFAGGRNEPLHDWYPYLEGYSPAFVESLFGMYCPTADRVFDPFGGSGTTPLTAARLGKTAYYSEINPVLQFLIASKVAALQLAPKRRSMVAIELFDLAATFGKRLSAVSPDAHLQTTYANVFGRSDFFDPEILEDVLRSRTLIDDIACIDPLAARYLTVAVLRSLVPVSRLIRRGDLRFKTKSELGRGSVLVRHAVPHALTLVARDIESLVPVDVAPILVLENAKNLAQLPNLAADASITSPPYLNGTNYFRNTKLELWFLRCLTTKHDLARYRFHCMTVGINDVTVKKPIGTLPASAKPVLEQLEERAYDSRIPRMVACFASEMHATLHALARHVRPRGTIAIDIGDSAYAGVRVPTDRFIVESLEAAGFELHQETVLRQRYSRSQMKLTQKLLIFRRAPVKRTRSRRLPSGSWSERWNRFKATLPHQSGDFAKRNWGHPLHSLCSYQGKMKPALAAQLIWTFTSPGNKLLDPFSGVGTIPFEAAQHGVESWGFDISAPAVHITAGKIGNCSATECEAEVARLDEYLQGGVVDPEERELAQTIRINGPVAAYFHPKTLDEILLARRFYSRHPPVRASESRVLASLLHILHGNRPYALSRRSHPITPFSPTGCVEYRALIPRLRAKLQRSVSIPKNAAFVHGYSLCQDATERWPMDVDQLDAVITSPPFFDSTRFYLGNWMRLWFCGWEARDFKQQPLRFVETRQKQSFDVYRPVLRQCRERLKTGGVVVLHLGASRKCDMAREVSRVARTYFRVADTYTENVTHCERHGIRDKGAVVSHQYVVLR